MGAGVVYLISMQVKSKQRVADFGEVFTAPREVNAMLDLVRHETERIESRFLEPACGTGNFLVEVLRRKLTVVQAKYCKVQLEYERYSILALTSIYGVEIQMDNVLTCRERLLEIFLEPYQTLYKKTQKNEYEATAAFILATNIIWGDALTLRTPDTGAKPIVFAEWSPLNGSLLKRRDFTLEKLLNNQPMDGPNLFSDLGDEAFIPMPHTEYPLTHFLKVGEQNDKLQEF